MKKKLALFFLLLLFIIIAYNTPYGDFVTRDQLRNALLAIRAFREAYPLLTPLLFIVLYALSTLLSLPFGIYLTLLSGILFTQPLATLYVLIGATLGATLLFMIAKILLRETLKRKFHYFIEKMRKGFEENKIFMLLFLRLAPIFPFWLVNIAPAFFRVTVWEFVWTTFFGILPGSFAISQSGVAFASLIEMEEPFTLENLFTIEMRIALFALALFALLPILMKEIKKRRKL